MSKDFQLAWPCDHRTIEEGVTLGSDRRSLLTRQPIASAGTVRVMVNDSFYIPQGGLLSVAQITGVYSGPFDLSPGYDTITVSTPVGTSTVNFGVTRLTRMTTEQIIKALQKANFTSAVVENIKGHLVFSDGSKIGPDSYIKVSGTASEILGFGSANCLVGSTSQRGSRGAQVYPSWSLATRTDDLVNRFPKFDFPVKGNPTFKVSYTVLPQRCLRCGGSLVENDYRYDINGQAILIGNENLLYQASLKMLLTDQGSNPYHTWYGNRIKSRIGSKAISDVATLISEDVRNALSRLQTMQTDQGKYQQVTQKEQLYAIMNVQVVPHKQDPTTFLVDVTVRNASGDPISLTIIFTVPSVVALMGSNGLMLGTEAVGLGTDTISDPGRLTIDGKPVG